jgi:hypothetical protein
MLVSLVATLCNRAPLKETIMTNRITSMFAALGLSLGLTACANDAQVASYNLSQAADNFKINRRIVFYNGITGDYMLTIEGLCSQEQTDKKLTVTCKVGEGDYKKHFLGLSDNVTYFSEQMEPAKVGTYFYRVTFKPSTIVPSVEVR